MNNLKFNPNPVHGAENDPSPINRYKNLGYKNLNYRRKNGLILSFCFSVYVFNIFSLSKHYF